jgi:hypothetical protein
MLTTDEAITLGIRKYRELYPDGVIPKTLEDAGVLNAIPGREKTIVLVAYSLRNQREPFILFKAIVDLQSGKVAVEAAADWHELSGKELDDSQTVT